MLNGLIEDSWLKQCIEKINSHFSLNYFQSFQSTLTLQDLNPIDIPYTSLSTYTNREIKSPSEFKFNFNYLMAVGSQGTFNYLKNEIV